MNTLSKHAQRVFKTHDDNTDGFPPECVHYCSAFKLDESSADMVIIRHHVYSLRQIPQFVRNRA